jgi:hypothetical protein
MAAREVMDRYNDLVAIIRGRGFFPQLNEYLIVAGEDVLRAIGNEQDFRRQGQDFRRLFGRFEEIAADTVNRIHRADCNRKLREGAGAGAGAGRIDPINERDNILATAILQIERLLDQHRVFNFVPRRGLFGVEAPENLSNAQNLARQFNREELDFLRANLGQIHLFDNDLQRHAYNEMLMERANQQVEEEEEEEKKEEEEQEEKKEEEDDVEEL